MVDPNGRIKKLAAEVTSNPTDVAEIKIGVLFKSILTDFATELADLVAGRMVRNGCEAETAKDVATLIDGHGKRFNIG